MGAEASVTLIVVLSIRLYHVPVYAKPVAIALAVTLNYQVLKHLYAVYLPT